MPVDYERLAHLRRYEDPDAGISEEFLDRRLGPDRSFALLSAPLSEPASLGWVLCPSLGPEHGNLRRLEALMARSLAAAGFPTLRVRPDIHPTRGASGEIDLSARLAEAGEAVELLRDTSRVRDVGLGGALFGGTVAALTADRLRAPGLALIEPVVRGKQYVRETIRRQAVAELVTAGDGAPARGETETERDGPAASPLDELSATGSTSLRGLLLSQEEYERISAVDLATEQLGLEGDALLVGLSPTGTASRGLTALGDRLRSLGAEVAVEVLQDPLPAPFGEYYYRNEGGVRVDTRLELDRRIVSTTTNWAVDTFVRGRPRVPA